MESAAKIKNGDHASSSRLNRELTRFRMAGMPRVPFEVLDISL
jgi:hypothetical protein